MPYHAKNPPFGVSGITETVKIEGISGSFQVFLGKSNSHFRVCYNESPIRKTYRASRSRAEALTIAYYIRQTGKDPRPPRYCANGESETARLP